MCVAFLVLDEEMKFIKHHFFCRTQMNEKTAFALQRLPIRRQVVLVGITQ